MAALVWLDESDLTFPEISSALDEPNGLLAAGGDLCSERLIEAYRQGIFPWYDEGQPILWWSPDPRCVIDPRTFEPSRSLARRIRQGHYEIRIDHAFDTVVHHCQHRNGDEGTWITPDMKAAYINLHREGVAHSVECYVDGALAGGLYGLSIGSLFFGESMFHRQTDASKLAFAHLMRLMAANDCPLVDCQVANDHLFSLGATEIPRLQFQHILRACIDRPGPDWALLAKNGVTG